MTVLRSRPRKASVAVRRSMTTREDCYKLTALIAGGEGRQEDDAGDGTTAIVTWCRFREEMQFGVFARIN